MHKHTSKLFICTKILFFVLLMSSLRVGMAENIEASNHELIPIMVLDFELLGDTSVESMKRQDALLLDKFSDEVRRRLKEQHIFNVIDDEKSLSTIENASKNQFLHRCNGCELQLAENLGAKQVLVPWVFRMSKLIQTMYFEIRDVETGKILMHKGLNFRGNTEDGWEHVTTRIIEETQKHIQRKTNY